MSVPDAERAWARDAANASNLPPSSFAAGATVRWWLFRAVEYFSSSRARVTGRVRARANPAPPFAAGTPSVWIFVSTIGELNAVAELLRRLIALIEPVPVTLLTDRTIYRAAYGAAFPGCFIYELDGTVDDVRTLERLTPPAALLLAEIPCFPGDGPCRLSFGALRAAIMRRAPIVLFNGWTYGYDPASLIDRIERRLLGRDFVHSLDLAIVQTDAVRDRMLAVGASPERVVVTGNVKFDLLRRPPQAPEASERVMPELGVREDRPIVVAGCVTDDAEQDLVVAAFARLRARRADALLVIAPRHPEEPAVLLGLERRLHSAGIDFVRRTVQRSGGSTCPAPCLVLDTFGELRTMYALAGVAHVGRDHNVLEPLAYGKRVTVLPGWDPRYPSYPVYQQLLQAQAITEVNDADQLAAAWAVALEDRRSGDPGGAVAGLTGATERDFVLIADLFERRGLTSRAA
jgi:3-deoxy-D-manno-octulosonic-acid transferase